MAPKLSPTLVARYEVTRSRELLMENHIIRENVRCEIIEIRQARENRKEARR